MDREAWRVAVHGVSKNLTRLSDWSELRLSRLSISCLEPPLNPRLVCVPIGGLSVWVWGQSYSHPSPLLSRVQCGVAETRKPDRLGLRPPFSSCDPGEVTWPLCLLFFFFFCIIFTKIYIILRVTTLGFWGGLSLTERLSGCDSYCCDSFPHHHLHSHHPQQQAQCVLCKFLPVWMK